MIRSPLSRAHCEDQMSYRVKMPRTAPDARETLSKCPPCAPAPDTVRSPPRLGDVRKQARKKKKKKVLHCSRCQFPRPSLSTEWGRAQPADVIVASWPPAQPGALRPPARVGAQRLPRSQRWRLRLWASPSPGPLLSHSPASPRDSLIHPFTRVPVPQSAPREPTRDCISTSCFP